MRTKPTSHTCRKLLPYVFTDNVSYGLASNAATPRGTAEQGGSESAAGWLRIHRRSDSERVPRSRVQTGGRRPTCKYPSVVY